MRCCCREFTRRIALLTGAALVALVWGVWTRHVHLMVADDRSRNNLGTARLLTAPAGTHREAAKTEIQLPYSPQDLQFATTCAGYASIKQSLHEGSNVSASCHMAMRISTLFVSHLLRHYDIKHWAMKGTLLGAIREQDILTHDYDVDFGFVYHDTNAIMRLRATVWKHGFILFEPPWGRYNNFQFCIMLRTEALVSHLLDHFVHTPLHYRRDISAQHFESGQHAWRLTPACERASVSVELMAFLPDKSQDSLVQVLCTHRQQSAPDASFSLLLSDTLWSDFQLGKKAFEQRKQGGGVKHGWLSWASTHTDVEYAMYKQRYGRTHVNRLCHHTAPYSFRYDSTLTEILPTRTAPFATVSVGIAGRISVPHDAHTWLRRYFGNRYLTPVKRQVSDFLPERTRRSQTAATT